MRATLNLALRLVSTTAVHPKWKISESGKKCGNACGNVHKMQHLRSSPVGPTAWRKWKRGAPKWAWNVEGRDAADTAFPGLYL